jgi:hypothetical protein
MNTYQFAATALVVGVIAPLFWLGVQWVGLRVDVWITRKWRLLREKTRQRMSNGVAAKLRRARRIAE